MKYCRRCDLAFCSTHEHLHPDDLGHPELVETPAAEFCSVCAGIYRPEPIETPKR